MIDPADRALIDRYFAGECSSEEAERAREILVAHLDERAAIEFAVTSLAADKPAPPRSAQQSLRALRARLAAASNRPRALHLGQSAAPPRRRSVRWIVAATVVIAAGTTLVWRETRLLDRARAAVPELKTFGTVRGQQATLELSDGARVTLAPESHLLVPLDYGVNMRAVRLDGEAYFEVHHDPRHPFSVRAGRAVAEDIGTKFDVRAYGPDAAVRVVVVEGMVAFGRAEQVGDTTHPPRVRLAEGTVASIDASGEPRVGEHVGPDPYISWRQGRLVFDRMPLRDALAELARWYDLDLQVADPVLANRPLTVSIGSAPVVEVLDAVAAAMDARWERDNQTITFVSARSGR